jgi:hypothetical protein
VTGHPGDTLSGIAAAHGGQLADLECEGYEPIIGPVAVAAGASRTSLTGVVAEVQA